MYVLTQLCSVCIQFTYWAATIRIVCRYEESELEHGSIVDATTYAQQPIPNCMHT